jgi:hypothetical protein
VELGWWGTRAGRERAARQADPPHDR